MDVDGVGCCLHKFMLGKSDRRHGFYTLDTVETKLTKDGERAATHVRKQAWIIEGLELIKLVSSAVGGVMWRV